MAKAKAKAALAIVDDHSDSDDHDDVNIDNDRIFDDIDTSGSDNDVARVAKESCDSRCHGPLCLPQLTDYTYAYPDLLDRGSSDPLFVCFL